ncbi:protein takeout [Halyomorpha halys]|uniref:protein takeout n=1 Tax=Halyomorpha halys TaxID=286706 RepID=UPI0006D50AEA|nr:protein takeout-like [Halyomorpha halys]
MLLPLLFACLFQGILSAANLPPPIKLCKNDNSLSQCVLKQSSAVIKTLVKGDPKFGIPVLDPMYIPKIEQTEGGTKSISLNLTLEKINLYGISKAEIIKPEIDTSKKFLKLIVHVPQLKLISDYNLSGKFLVVPVTGKGKSTILVDDVMVTYIYRFKLAKKKGADYVTSVPPADLTYTTKKITFNFENLFNGDKTLGDATNKMINENWEEFNKQLGKGVGLGIGQVFNLVLDKVAGSVPFSELFVKS